MTTAEHIKSSLKQFKPTSHKINHFDPNLHENSIRFFKIEDEKGDKFKLFVFTDTIKIETSVKTSLLFSINLPDNICLANKPLANGKGIKVYTDHSNDDAVLLCVNLIKASIIDLELGENEGLFLYRNLVQLAVSKDRQLIPEIISLQNIKSIIENKFPEEAEIIDASKIPMELQNLIPILSEWAISDDLARGEKIKQSSKAKLKKMIDTVDPKMMLINNYLNNFKSEPLPYEATLIGNLAELVTEIKPII